MSILHVITTGKTRKAAAVELMAIYNAYEVRKVTFATIYRRIWRDSRTGNWRLIGHAHDYTTEG
jgi:hypothetical protein